MMQELCGNFLIPEIVEADNLKIVLYFILVFFCCCCFCFYESNEALQHLFHVQRCLFCFFMIHRGKLMTMLYIHDNEYHKERYFPLCKYQTFIVYNQLPYPCSKSIMTCIISLVAPLMLPPLDMRTLLTLVISVV